MTKAELVEKMATDANVSKVAAGAVLDSFMTNVTKALKKDPSKSVFSRMDFLAMAEVGADVIENPVTVEPQPIGDISDLSMAEVGSDVLEHHETVTPQPIGDISGISMAEPGADLIENPKPRQALIFSDPFNRLSSNFVTALFLKREIVE